VRYSGATWARTDLTVRLGANEDGRGAGERLLVDPRDSEHLWLGTRHDGLLHSTDSGAAFTRGATGLPSGDVQFTLAAAPAAPVICGCRPRTMGCCGRWTAA
jgi:hypothetical protein